MNVANTNVANLQRIAESNDNNKVMIIEEGGIGTILSAMKTHSSNADVQENGCLALMILAYNVNSKVAISKACGKAAIESAMLAYQSQAAQENGNRALLAIELVIAIFMRETNANNAPLIDSKIYWSIYYLPELFM